MCKELTKKLKEELKELKKKTDKELIEYIEDNSIYKDYVLDHNCDKIGVCFRVYKDYATDHSIWVNSEYMELEGYKKGDLLETLPLGRELGAKVKFYVKEMFLARA
jgi:hypothetical protein